MGFAVGHGFNSDLLHVSLILLVPGSYLGHVFQDGIPLKAKASAHILLLPPRFHWPKQVL